MATLASGRDRKSSWRETAWSGNRCHRSDIVNLIGIIDVACTAVAEIAREITPVPGVSSPPRSSNPASTASSPSRPVKCAAVPGSSAAGHMDLVTVLAHEMGHVLGLKDNTSMLGDIMDPFLAPGSRWLPTAQDVARLP